MSEILPEADSAVAVTGPFDRKLCYPVSVAEIKQDDLDIEHKTVGLALSVELPRNFPSIHLESALRVG
ncbi:MAG: hypothetical protein HW389_3664 [Bacteroidetes bacterium]|nr:hypothetical protein [Bacteroidota bacterium]